MSNELSETPSESGGATIESAVLNKRMSKTKYYYIGGLAILVGGLYLYYTASRASRPSGIRVLPTQLVSTDVSVAKRGEERSPPNWGWGPRQASESIEEKKMLKQTPKKPKPIETIQESKRKF